MESFTILGIDPGKHGGLVTVRASYMGLKSISRMTPEQLTILDPVVSMMTIPESRYMVYEWIKGHAEHCHVYLEEVGGYHGDNPLPGSMMFEFGRSYGALEMAVEASGFAYGSTFFRVRPQVWQRTCGIAPKMKPTKRHPGMPTETDSQWKARLKAKAHEIFPRHAFTNATADAALIAYHGLCQFVSGVNDSAKVS